MRTSSRCRHGVPAMAALPQGAPHSMHRMPVELWDNILTRVARHDSTTLQSVAHTDRFLSAVVRNPHSPVAPYVLRRSIAVRRTMAEVFAVLKDPAVQPILTHVTGLNFENKNMTHADLKRLCRILGKRCPRLRGLSLGGNNLRGRSLECLRMLSQLDNVCLKNNRLDALGTHFLSQLKLKKLGLENTNMSEDALANVAEIETLEVLVINGNALHNDALGAFLLHENLHTLHAANNQFNCDALDLLEFMPLLRELDISKNPLNDQGGYKFGSLCDLEVLCAKECGLGANAAAGIGKLTKLRRLVLSQNFNIGSAIAAEVPKLTDLHELHLYGTNLQGRDVRSITNNTYITKLDIGKNPLEDDGLQTVGNLSRLRTLGISEVQATHKGLAWIKALPKLRVLDASHNQLNEKSGAPLRRLRCLHTLRMGHNPLGNRALLDLSQIHTLRNLHLPDARIGAAGTKRLKHRSFRTLQLSGNPIGDKGVRNMLNLRAYFLDLDDTNITPAVLPTVAQVGGLRHLALRDNNLTSVRGLEAIESLRGLALCGNKLTVDALGPVQAHRYLKFIDLTSNQFDGDALGRGFWRRFPRRLEFGPQPEPRA